ncbi:MAG: helix-turn-helix domain-containing protein [Anaerolineales bacterium]|nr:helix-turn-helix domain-containing protein [Anaerolineales bacterium]
MINQISRKPKAAPYFYEAALPRFLCLQFIQILDKPVSVDKLAAIVHMSRTAFYLNFKGVMQVSPLQYAKSVKLHEAQKLIKEGRRGNEARYLVGYNNLPQFSREYKRHFGYAPSMT